MKVLSIAVVLFSVAWSLSEAIWCKDAEGNEVEWSLIYKLPKRATDEDSGAPSTLPEGGPDGTDFGYIDSRMIADGKKNFSMGAFGIDSVEQNPLANTLEPIYKWSETKADKELAYIAYNDQPPVDEKQSNDWRVGHTKGLVVFDSNTGIWIVHSVPKFPEKMFSGSFSFPKNGYVYGQTLLCMTFKNSVLDTIAAHLLNQRPHIFRSNAPKTMLDAHQNLSLLLSDEKHKPEQNVSKNTLQGVQGYPFLAFAKSGLLDADVYSETIAPALNSDLYVNTWQNGEGGRLDSECSLKYDVLDVEDVTFTISNTTASWPAKKDHAKWAVSTKDSKWLCIGSINRMKSQFKRGGETVCLSEQRLGKLFKDAVTNHTTCGDNPRKN